MSTSDSQPVRDPLYYTDNEILCVVTYQAFFPSLFVLSIIAMILTIYKHFKSRNSSDNTCTFWLATSLYLSLLVLFALYVAAIASVCHHYWLFVVLRPIQSSVYTTQWLLLLAFQFCRLYTVFHKSMFALSRCTIAIWCILYSLAVLLVYVGSIANGLFIHRWGAIATLFISAAFLLFLILVVFLNILFIYKVVKVYKNVNTEAKYINVMTKISLLAFVSTIFSVITAVVVSISPYFPHFYMGVLRVVTVSIDCLTNFWCTALAFHHFDAWYKKVCCDATCKRVWFRVLRGRGSGDDDEKVMAEIQKKEVPLPPTTGVVAVDTVSTISSIPRETVLETATSTISSIDIDIDDVDVLDEEVP